MERDGAAFRAFMCDEMVSRFWDKMGRRARRLPRVHAVQQHSFQTRPHPTSVQDLLAYEVRGWEGRGRGAAVCGSS